VSSDDVYADTRRQVHGLAEALIAGPQYRSDGTIRLKVTSRGFAGTKASLAIEGMEFVWAAGRAPLAGAVADLAVAAGIEAGPPVGAYDIAEPLADGAVLDLDTDSVRQLEESLRVGAEALESFAAEQPVLWPEHLDVAVTVDEVNYGVSGGDSYHVTPYAYVGPWKPRTGPFWNAPFGAVLDMSTPTEPDRLIRFFTQGRDLTR
jgi:hypothetical protein